MMRRREWITFLSGGWRASQSKSCLSTFEHGPASLLVQSCRIESCGFKSSSKRVPVELLQQVEGLGGPGDVTYVPPGYARNFLIPNRMARIRIENTQTTKRMRGLPLAASLVAEAPLVEQAQRGEELRHQEDEQEALRIKKETKKLETIVRKLTETTITHRGRVQGDGVLESSIGPKDITVAVAKQLGIEIVEELIDMEGDVIDTTGDFLIPLKLIQGDGMRAKIQLRVVSS